MALETAYVLPGTGATDGSGTAWSNPTRITADDNSTASTASTTRTQYLVGTNFGLDSKVPEGATIVGVGVQIEARYSIGSGIPQIYGIELRKDGAVFGSVVNANINLTTSLVKYEFGGVGQLFGNTAIAYEDIEASTFGVAWYARCTDIFQSATYLCDAVWLKIYYELSQSTAARALAIRRTYRRQ